MIRSLFNEEWKIIIFDDKISKKEKFKVSNYGRIINFKNQDKPYLKKESFTNGYVSISVKQEENAKTTGRYVHKLVAQHFLEKKMKNKFLLFI